MRFLAVAFTGVSGSGKTTTIVEVVKSLGKTSKVAVVKHDPKNKADFDVQGKDSWRFSQTGAEVVVASSKKTTYFLKQGMDIERIINVLNPFDFLIVEGLKTLPLPRIGIFRDSIDETYLPYCDALALKNVDTSKYDLKGLDVLDLDDTNGIISWIEKNAKKVR